MNEKLNKKLLELQKSVRALSKDGDGYGYQYVTGSKLLFFIRPKMDELGLRLVPSTVSVEQQVVKTAEEDDTKGKPAKYEVLVLLHKTFTWVDTESGESETTDFYAQGCNGWDKGIGSAETYAERYFILKYFHIATDEDDVDAPHASAVEDVQPSAPLSLDDVIKLATNASDAEALQKVWNTHKERFGKDASFVMAISQNPNNPKKR